MDKFRMNSKLDKTPQKQIVEDSDNFELQNSKFEGRISICDLGPNNMKEKNGNQSIKHSSHNLNNERQREQDHQDMMEFSPGGKKLALKQVIQMNSNNFIVQNGCCKTTEAGNDTEDIKTHHNICGYTEGYGNQDQQKQFILQQQQSSIPQQQQQIPQQQQNQKTENNQREEGQADLMDSESGFIQFNFNNNAMDDSVPDDAMQHQEMGISFKEYRRQSIQSNNQKALENENNNTNEVMNKNIQKRKDSNKKSINMQSSSNIKNKMMPDSDIVEKKSYEILNLILSLMLYIFIILAFVLKMNDSYLQISFQIIFAVIYIGYIIEAFRSSHLQYLKQIFTKEQIKEYFQKVRRANPKIKVSISGEKITETGARQNVFNEEKFLEIRKSSDLSNFYKIDYLLKKGICFRVESSFVCTIADKSLKVLIREMTRQAERKGAQFIQEKVSYQLDGLINNIICSGISDNKDTAQPLQQNKIENAAQDCTATAKSNQNNCNENNANNTPNCNKISNQQKSISAFFSTFFYCTFTILGFSWFYRMIMQKNFPLYELEFQKVVNSTL